MSLLSSLSGGDGGMHLLCPMTSTAGKRCCDCCGVDASLGHSLATVSLTGFFVRWRFVLRCRVRATRPSRRRLSQTSARRPETFQWRSMQGGAVKEMHVGKIPTNAFCARADGCCGWVRLEEGRSRLLFAMRRNVTPRCNTVRVLCECAVKHSVLFCGPSIHDGGKLGEAGQSNERAENTQGCRFVGSWCPRGHDARPQVHHWCAPSPRRPAAAEQPWRLR